MPDTVLQLLPLPEPAEQALERLFRVIRLPSEAREAEAILATEAHAVGGIATTGRGLVDDALLARLPELKIIASFSAGLDQIDLAAAKRRGIPVTNTSHVLAGDVADIGIALILMQARQLVAAREWVVDGSWSKAAFPAAISLRGKRLGIVGLGHIGSALAVRAEALGMTVQYHGRQPKEGVRYAYFDKLSALAANSDFLAASCPATPQTKGLIDAAVLEALGPEGWLINIARGSVVDEAALIDALKRNHIAGAGLDVCENEPHPALELLSDERVVLLPHIGTATRETREAMAQSMIDALLTHLRAGSNQTGRQV